MIIKNIMISFLFFVYLTTAFLYREYVAGSCAIIVAVGVASVSDLYNIKLTMPLTI